MKLRGNIARTHGAAGHAAMPLTALIDVVFLVLIFFLFSSFGFAEAQVLTALSRAGGAVDSLHESTWLRLRRGPADSVEYAVDDGRFSGSTDFTEQVLARRFSEFPAEPTVIIDPQGGVLLQELLDSFALARRAGARQVALRADGDRP